MFLDGLLLFWLPLLGCYYHLSIDKIQLRYTQNLLFYRTLNCNQFIKIVFGFKNVG